MSKSLEKLIRKLPKQDLHLHLDGSIRLDTMIDLAKSQKIKLPSYTLEGLEVNLFKDHYNSLEEYLKTFAYSCAVMQTPENLERIAYELAVDCQDEGVCYIEVRFDPLLLTNSKQSSKQVLQAVNKGLKKAQADYNQNLASNQPAFHYAIIICALRSLGPWSELYTKIFDSFAHLSNKKVTKLIALEQVNFAIQMKEQGIPVVAFDLAGAEKGHPCDDFDEAFTLATQNLLHKTVHAGEGDGVHSIMQAICILGAERIGHGFALFAKQKAYTRDLLHYIINKNITIEVCLTSNLQTMPDIKKIENHSYKKMLANNLNIVVCTDNRTASKTSITKELLLARTGMVFQPTEFKRLVLQGFSSSFFPDATKKRDYCQLCNDYYDFIVKNTQLAVLS